MRQVLFVLLSGVCAASVWGKVFHMDSRGDATVEVNPRGGEYRVTCTFSPQTKFDDAVNAKFNDAKGDSLCKKGIMRYLNAGTNDLLSISGLYSVAPVKNVGGKVRYAFAVPVAGCEIMVGAAPPKTVPGTAVNDVPVVTNAAPGAQESKVVRSASYLSVVRYKEVNGRRSVVSQREYRDGDFGSRQEFCRFCASEFSRVRDLSEENFHAVLGSGE